MNTSMWTPTLTVPLTEGRDHILGPPDAPVTLVEYGDYECPYCGLAHPIVKTLLSRIGDTMRFAFRHFPITTSHPHAARAALAAEAAGAQDRFWQMHDLLYENQGHLDDPRLSEYAGALGLDLRRFGEDLAAERSADRIHEDFMSGVHSGVNGTPTFFINGVRHDEAWDLDTLLAAVEAAAAAPGPME